MRRAIRRRASRPYSFAASGGRAAASGVLTLFATACTLNLTVPSEPPRGSWDPNSDTHPNATRFQELLDRYVHEGLPGVVLLVRTPLGLWNGAAGYAKLETADPMVPTHVHHAASVTKMYTATAVLILAEEGVIDLDTRISHYLPESTYGSIPNGSKATVRQLLAHRSGIPDFSGDMRYDLDFLNDPMGSYPPERLLSYLQGQSPIAAPGTGYFYSNANYYLLALLMDHVTEGSHADVTAKRILEPLGLSSTYYKTQQGFPTPPGLVNSYQDLAGDGRLMNVTDLATHSADVFMGNSSLMATSENFAVFLEALLEGKVLGPTMLAEMQEWTEPSRYGLGLSFSETAYGRAVGHSGGDTGVLSQVQHFPDLDTTLVLLSNGGNGGVAEELFGRLWDEALEMALAGL